MDELKEAIKEIKRGLKYGVSCGKDSVWKNRNAQEVLVKLAENYIRLNGMCEKEVSNARD